MVYNEVPLREEEILATLYIARDILMKHLQNIYRKCGVASRWALRKLRGT